MADDWNYSTFPPIIVPERLMRTERTGVYMTPEEYRGMYLRFRRIYDDEMEIPEGTPKFQDIVDAHNLPPLTKGMYTWDTRTGEIIIYLDGTEVV